MSRTLAVIAIVALVLLGAGLGAAAGYQLGVSTAINTAVTQSGATVVTPVGPWGYGWGGPGFGLFGFLGVLLFVFVVFALLRAAFFGGARRRWDGPAGWGGPGDLRHDRWQGRAREVFDDFHRRAHESEAPRPTD